MSTQVVYDYGGSVSTINGLLKDDYVMQGVIDQVNKATVLLDKMRSKKSSHGRQHIFSIQVNTSRTGGARAEGAALPAPGFGRYEQPTGTVKYNYSRFQINTQAIEATRGNKAAFAEAFERALTDCRDDLKLTRQRQSWGDGSGVLAKVDGTVTASATVPVKDPYGYTYSGTLAAQDRVITLKAGMPIFFGTAAVARTILAVNRAAGTITVDSNVTLTNNDNIFHGGASTAGLEMDGLGAIVGTSGTYLGLNRATTPNWQSHVFAAPAGQLSEDLMRMTRDEILSQGTGDVELIITTFGVRRLYESLLKSFKRFTNPMKLEGGYDALEWDGLPIVVDKDAPPQKMYFLQPSSMTRFVMKDVGWNDQDGSILKWVDGYDSWTAYLSVFDNLGCTKPNNQARIDGITTIPPAS
jgi:hypothetical protein